MVDLILLLYILIYAYTPMIHIARCKPSHAHLQQLGVGVQVLFIFAMFVYVSVLLVDVLGQPLAHCQVFRAPINTAYVTLQRVAIHCVSLSVHNIVHIPFLLMDLTISHVIFIFLQC